MSLSIDKALPYGQIMAAYRPIVISVKSALGDNVEVVYADVYFNGAFYQTIHTTVWEKFGQTVVLGGGLYSYVVFYRRFEFDFQRVCQDFLRSRLPPNIAGKVMEYDASGAARMQVRFRAGILNSSNLIDVAIASELVSDETVVVNAAVPHDSVPVLRDYLAQFKYSVWNSAVLALMPLTECPGTCFTTRSQYSHYPFLPEYNGLAGSNNSAIGAYMIIEFQYKGSEQLYSVPSDYNQAAGKFDINGTMANYLPVGIPQLRLLPWLTDFGPFWDQIVRWRVKLRYDATLPLVTPWYYVPAVECENALRVRFLNRLGAYDSANFEEASLEGDTTSSYFQSTVKSIPPVGGLRVRGRQRYNVRTAQRITATTTLYPESAQDWLSQLIDSPDVHIERPAIGGRPADFIPVVVEDAKAVLRKIEDRYLYEQTIILRYANETPRQRM